MLLNYSALLDLKGNSSLDNIRCVIGDGNVYRLNVLVALSGQIVDLTGHTARITFVKPDGHVVWQNMTIDDATSGSMYCVFENQVYAVEGTVQAEIELYDNGTNRLTTATFTLTARRGLLDDSAVESSSEFTALDDALEAVQGFDSIKSEIVTARGGYASLGARLTALDNIQIGGVNLITNSDCENGVPKLNNSSTSQRVSDTLVTDKYYTGSRSLLITNTSSNSLDNFYQFGSYSSNNLDIGTNCYTFSAYVYVPSGQDGLLLSNIYLRIYEHTTMGWDVTNKGNSPTQFDTWQRISVTRQFNNGEQLFVRVYLGTDVVGSKIYIDNLQLEQGNKATAWSLAPEDITAYIDSRSIPFLGTTTNTGNNYNVVAPNYSAVDGRSFTIRFNADSTGAVQISFNSGGLVPIYRYDGTQVDNIKAGSVVHLIWSIVSGVYKLYIS